MKYILFMVATFSVALVTTNHVQVKPVHPVTKANIDDSIRASYAVFVNDIQQSKKEINFKLTQLAVYNRRIDSTLRVKKCH